jgi:hypothetical protein
VCTHALNKSNDFLPSPSSLRYEWDTLGYALGSNHTKCDRPNAPGISHANCGFDTHYPDYFPARQVHISVYVQSKFQCEGFAKLTFDHYPDYFPARQGCKEATAAMQAAGMRVIPYINGQLYDTEIPRWTTDHANASVQKFQAQTMATTLSPHLEHFDGITSAVMCTFFCVVVWRESECVVSGVRVTVFVFTRDLLSASLTPPPLPSSTASLFPSCRPAHQILARRHEGHDRQGVRRDRF